MGRGPILSPHQIAEVRSRKSKRGIGSLLGEVLSRFAKSAHSRNAAVHPKRKRRLNGIVDICSRDLLFRSAIAVR